MGGDRKQVKGNNKGEGRGRKRGREGGGWMEEGRGRRGGRWRNGVERGRGRGGGRKRRKYRKEIGSKMRGRKIRTERAGRRDGVGRGGGLEGGSGCYCSTALSRSLVGGVRPPFPDSTAPSSACRGRCRYRSRQSFSLSIDVFVIFPYCLFCLACGEQVLGVVGGTVGLFEQSTVEITDDLLDAYRNQVLCYNYCAYYCCHILCLLLLSSTVPTTVVPHLLSVVQLSYCYFFLGSTRRIAHSLLPWLRPHC